MSAASPELRVGQVWKHRYKRRQLTVTAVETTRDGEIYVIPRYDTSRRTQWIAEPTLRRHYLLEREAAPVPVGREQAAEALREAAFAETLEDGGPGRTLIHAFSHAAGMALGADHDLDEALRTLDDADEIAWCVHPLGHDLGVRAAGRVLYFAVRRPAGVLGA